MSQFPEELKPMIGVKFGCQSCQHRFEVEEFHKPSGKKSKTWIFGQVLWGVKQPQFCDAFIIKCPGCGDPAQVVIISQKKDAASLLVKAEPERLQKEELPPKKKAPFVEPPKQEQRPLTAPPRRIERKPLVIPEKG